MATAIDAKGDLIVGTGSDTFSRLAVGGTNGHVLTVDSGEATGVKWAAASGGGGGKVLQVVSATYSTATSTTSATMADTGLSASITPSAATSKVLVLVQQFVTSSRTGLFAGSGWRLMRGSTSIAGDYESNIMTVVNGTSDNKENYGTLSFSYLDSPSTTSSTTYKTQFRVTSASGSASATAQLMSVPSSIVLMEIGA
jgi:hypothetical protein